MTGGNRAGSYRIESQGPYSSSMNVSGTGCGLEPGEVPADTG